MTYTTSLQRYDKWNTDDLENEEIRLINELNFIRKELEKRYLDKQY